MPTIRVDCCHYPELCSECEERMRRYYAEEEEASYIEAQVSADADDN